MNIFGVGHSPFNFAVLLVRGDLMHYTYSITCKRDRTTKEVVVLSSEILPCFSPCNGIELLDLPPSMIWHGQQGLKVAASYVVESRIEMKPVSVHIQRNCCFDIIC